MIRVIICAPWTSADGETYRPGDEAVLFEAVGAQLVRDGFARLAPDPDPLDNQDQDDDQDGQDDQDQGEG